ncbi:MAG TPA: 4-(cytidine 5'-diphospho)-2-C-methyl-D-erythritol kinase [Vicinamibacterales bacterium]|nr:4-(cytidine 5'-diphospho)-2-C-methyl-D-erythritol kinase [Vicinamibacterales bacterium]
MSQSALLVVRAYAKINLDLKVLGLRPDGYHDVRTVLQSLDLHDTLSFAAAPGPFAIACNQPGVPTDARNLVWRAAQLLWSLTAGHGAPLEGVQVTLDKRVPAAAGMGGGSSDAAAALLALSHIWGLSLDLASLARLGARLGADVPFFLGGGTALGSGKGDEVSPLVEPPPTPVVVVKPPFGIPTPNAYAWFDQDGPVRARRPAPRTLPGWPAWAHDLRNDLETPVARRFPQIRRIVRELTALGAIHSAMTGSGSAVFGLFGDQALAAAAQAALAGRGEVAVLTATLPGAIVAGERQRVLAGG